MSDVGMAVISGEEEITAYASDSGTTVTVVVNKQWYDGNDNHADETTTMHLYKDGVDTGQEIILGAGNGWTGQWTDLTDDGTYTVKEEEKKGWYADMMRTETETTGGTYWIPMSQFEKDAVFAIVYDSVNALAYTGNTTVNTATVTRGTGSIMVNGRTYKDYLTAVPDTAQWKAETTDISSKIYNTKALASQTSWLWSGIGYLCISKDGAKFVRENEAETISAYWAGGYSFLLYGTANWCFLKNSNETLPIPPEWTGARSIPCTGR